MKRLASTFAVIAALAAGSLATLAADPPAAHSPAADPNELRGPGLPTPAEKPSGVDTAGLKRLDPNCDVWIDPQGKRVILEGEVCLREGPLELFACLRGYKEHEAIVRVNTKAYIVHAGLLAVGAKPGSPVQFRPKFEPASGSTIDIEVYWTDVKGAKQHVRAQDWIRDVKTKKTMEYSWVFAGSRIWRDEEGQQHYAAEGGDFVCVSNFPSAMLDVPVASTDSNDDLMFDALTEKIPERLTKVTLVLTPRGEAKPADGKPAGGAAPGATEVPADKNVVPPK